MQTDGEIWGWEREEKRRGRGGAIIINRLKIKDTWYNVRQTGNRKRGRDRSASCGAGCEKSEIFWSHILIMWLPWILPFFFPSVNVFYHPKVPSVVKIRGSLKTQGKPKLMTSQSCGEETFKEDIIILRICLVHISTFKFCNYIFKFIFVPWRKFTVMKIVG